nr:MAG TPA: hypothetical protein [Caudoviricetes sp.]DAU54204.1 MAG TPA: hypothetical protein [Bacteriophage sp.]
MEKGLISHINDEYLGKLQQGKRLILSIMIKGK